MQNSNSPPGQHALQLYPTAITHHSVMPSALPFFLCLCLGNYMKFSSQTLQSSRDNLPTTSSSEVPGPFQMALISPLVCALITLGLYTSINTFTDYYSRLAVFGDQSTTPLSCAFVESWGPCFHELLLPKNDPDRSLCRGGV